MNKNQTTYKGKDELAEMFSKRNAARPDKVQTVTTTPSAKKPVQSKTATNIANTPKRMTKAEREKRRRNRQIANLMIYGGIIVLVVLCIIVAIVLVTSGNGAAIKSIKFSTDSIAIKTGESQKLTVITEPADVEYAMTFTSSDDAVTVSKDGTITANKMGTATITVESSGLKAQCQVIVNADTITSLSFSEAKAEIGGGEEYKCVINTVPQNAGDKNLVFESSDKAVAEVDENGAVMGIEKGTAVITVTDTVTGIKSSMEITVTGTLLPESMAFKESAITLEIGEVYNSELVMTPDNIADKSSIYYTTDINVASVTNEGVITAKGAGTCTIEAYYEKDNTVVAYLEVTVIDPFVITGEQTESEAPKPESSQPGLTPEVPGLQVIDGITYVQGILIANKTYGLPSTYDPGTDNDAYNALYEMEEDAAKEGIILFLNSGYRDYDTQEAIYNNYVSMDGKAQADTYSARPGHSEHQTGLAFDLNSFEESFGETAEGIWLAKNCHKYGFIIRYPKGKEHITGYIYEPWHVRYLGKDTATKVYNSGLCLEEYLGITSKYQD